MKTIKWKKIYRAFDSLSDFGFPICVSDNNKYNYLSDRHAWINLKGCDYEIDKDFEQQVVADGTWEEVLADKRGGIQLPKSDVEEFIKLTKEIKFKKYDYIVINTVGLYATDFVGNYGLKKKWAGKLSGFELTVFNSKPFVKFLKFFISTNKSMTYFLNEETIYLKGENTEGGLMRSLTQYIQHVKCDN